MADQFASELKVEKIPGVGKITREKMNRLGIFTCADRVSGLFAKIKFSDFRVTTIDRAQHKSLNPHHFELLIKEAMDRASIPVRLIGIGVRLGEPREECPSQLCFSFFNIR